MFVLYSRVAARLKYIYFLCCLLFIVIVHGLLNGRYHGKSLMEGAPYIFIYTDSASSISFEIDCVYGVNPNI